MNTEQQKKILIIEDDEFLADILVERLTKEDLNFKLALNGEDGVKIAKEIKPDLILLDIILPGIDGFEVLRQIKSDPELALINVIMLSNLGKQSDKERATQLGATDFIVKADLYPSDIIKKIYEQIVS